MKALEIKEFNKKLKKQKRQEKKVHWNVGKQIWSNQKDK